MPLQTICNTNTDNDEVDNNVGADFEVNDNSHRVFNPAEKIAELYERLLKEEKEKYNTLEQRLSALEQQMKEQK